MILNISQGTDLPYTVSEALRQDSVSKLSSTEFDMIPKSKVGVELEI